MLRQLWVTLGKLRECRRNEKLTREQLLAAKLLKFRQLVRHVAVRSPYYADIIRERAIDLKNCKPEDFPVLTKTMLLANFDRIATDPRITKRAIIKFLERSTDPGELFLNEFQVIHTSGSSGEVGYFVFSPDDWYRGMVQRMRSRPKGVPLRRLKVMFYGAVNGHFAGISMASLAKRGVNKLIAQMADCEINTPLPQVIEQLNAYQPDLLAGYITALKMLARKQQDGTLRIRPLRIEAGGETMTEADRKYLTQVFGCEVFNVYACSEHLMMGISRPGESHMVLYDDDLHYECCNDHTLVTNLFNFTLPLIRYRMSDILRSVPNPLGPYLAIDNVVGRVEMAPAFLNRDGVEDFISAHTINEIFVAGVERFQMRLTSRTSFMFAVCLAPMLTTVEQANAILSTEHRLRELLDQKSMTNVSFEVLVVDDLPLDTKTRKFKLIVNS